VVITSNTVIPDLIRDPFFEHKKKNKMDSGSSPERQVLVNLVTPGTTSSC